ncbi:MAG: response regulator [Gemmatimonadota bacterium]|nr:response regulator [Gemmatimonadota bacterium]
MTHDSDEREETGGRPRSPFRVHDGGQSDAVRGPSVLLIDTDVGFRDALSQALDRFGITLVWRARVLGLLDAITDRQPTALILSGDLAAGDPIELIRAIRRQPRLTTLPIYLVGSSVSPSDELRAYAEGADAVLRRADAISRIAARLLGLSRLDTQRRSGTAKSIADAALALCAASGSHPETVGGPAPHAPPAVPADPAVTGGVPRTADSTMTGGSTPANGSQTAPAGGFGPPFATPFFPGYPFAGPYMPMPMQPWPVPHAVPYPWFGAPPPPAQPGSPDREGNGYGVGSGPVAPSAGPLHTAAHAPPNQQFAPPEGYGAPPADEHHGLGAEYRGAPPETAGGAGASARAIRASVPDVIVVEDDPSLLEMLRYALTNRGFSTLSFSNGLDALRSLREMETADRNPVVLLDVDLPGLDGFRILHELSGARPGVFQIILCTVHSSEATQVLGIQSGAIDYLVKPLRMPIVLAKVERLLGQGGLPSAAGGQA